MTSTIAITVVAIQAKHDDNMLFLRKLIEKSLLLKDFFSATLFFNLDATAKISFFANILSKTLTKKWNQANLYYFDPHFDKAHDEDKIVLVDKNVYYKNIVLFVQHLQSLVIFQSVALVKANIATLLQGSAFEWYILELNDFNCNVLNNYPSMKNWINILSHCFKIQTSIALDFLLNEIYPLNNAWTRQFFT